jgi:hypothetical protein
MSEMFKSELLISEVLGYSQLFAESVLHLIENGTGFRNEQIIQDLQQHTQDHQVYPVGTMMENVRRYRPTTMGRADPGAFGESTNAFQQVGSKLIAVTAPQRYAGTKFSHRCSGGVQCCGVQRH